MAYLAGVTSPQLALSKISFLIPQFRIRCTRTVVYIPFHGHQLIRNISLSFSSWVEPKGGHANIFSIRIKQTVTFWAYSPIASPQTSLVCKSANRKYTIFTIFTQILIPQIYLVCLSAEHRATNFNDQICLISANLFFWLHALEKLDKSRCSPVMFTILSIIYVAKF